MLSFLIGLAIITIYYNFSSSLKYSYLNLKNSYAKDNKYLAVITKNGLWIKDKIDRNYDHYINIFGADHHGYVARLTSAFNLIKKPKQNIEHILYQLVNLYEDGRKNTMSTRKGKFLSLNDLLNEFNSDLIKFFFLEKKYDHEIDFDTKLAKENSKNNPLQP